MLFGFPQHPGAVVGAGCAVARGIRSGGIPGTPDQIRVGVRVLAGCEGLRRRGGDALQLTGQCRFRAGIASSSGSGAGCVAAAFRPAV
jgi:hypothetical protein